MKNRKREIRTSGSVRDEDGQHPHLLGHVTVLAGQRRGSGQWQAGTVAQLLADAGR